MYSFSINLSIFFLISGTLSTPLFRVTSITSATSSWCPIVFLLFIILTIAACVSKFLSAATRSCVSLFSASVSFSCTWLILIRYFSWVKDVFRVNVSVGEMSRPWGCLRRGRSLAQARDWRVRFSSASAVGRVVNKPNVYQKSNIRLT
jgi:Na+-driven multidrug efflux pump